MARELIAKIVDEEFNKLYIWRETENKWHPFIIEFKKLRGRVNRINISIEEYDKLIEALLKTRIIKIEKEFEV